MKKSSEKSAKRLKISLTPTKALHILRPTDTQNSAAARWNNYFITFMRCLSFLWLIQGLVLWSHFFLADSIQPDSWRNLPTSTNVTLMFFAVMDPIVAVALWFASPWGNILWLLILVSKITVFSIRGTAVLITQFVLILYIILILLYFYIHYQWSHAQKSQNH